MVSYTGDFLKVDSDFLEEKNHFFKIFSKLLFFNSLEFYRYNRPAQKAFIPLYTELRQPSKQNRKQYPLKPLKIEQKTAVSFLYYNKICFTKEQKTGILLFFNRILQQIPLFSITFLLLIEETYKLKKLPVSLQNFSEYKSILT